MRVTDNPFEIGMDRLVDLEMEADFVGKEALKKIKKEGIKRTGCFSATSTRTKIERINDRVIWIMD